MTRCSRTATSRGTSRSGCACAGDSPRRATSARRAELLALVGLAGFERRSVATLSGGEQQRVALARALAPEPRLLLLDEPLGSLDRPLRDRLLDDLEALFDELGSTAVYVTHDQAEAFALGDRVAVMRDGRVVQVATPDELWARPRGRRTSRASSASPTSRTTRSSGPRRCPSGARRATASGVVERSFASGRVVSPARPPRRRRGARGGASGARAPACRRPGRRRRRPEAASSDCPHDPAPRRRPRARPGRVLPRDGATPTPERRRHGLGREHAADGTVEAVFEGEREAVDRLVDFCREGPRGARVERVDVVAEEPEGLSGFAVR